MSRRGQGIIFGAVTVLWALVLPLAAMMALMSVMMSDAGTNAAVYTAMALAFGWPVSIILFVLAGWIAFAFQRSRTAAALFGAPLVYLVLMIASVSVLLDHFGPRTGH